MSLEIETVPLRSGTTAQWGESGIVLGVGELGVDRVTRALKVGDGVNLFADLPPVNAGLDVAFVAHRFTAGLNGAISGTEQVNYGTPFPWSSAPVDGFGDEYQNRRTYTFGKAGLYMIHASWTVTLPTRGPSDPGPDFAYIEMFMEASALNWSWEDSGKAEFFANEARQMSASMLVPIVDPFTDAVTITTSSNRGGSLNGAPVYVTLMKVA